MIIITIYFKNWRIPESLNCVCRRIAIATAIKVSISCNKIFMQLILLIRYSIFINLAKIVPIFSGTCIFFLIIIGKNNVEQLHMEHCTLIKFHIAFKKNQLKVWKLYELTDMKLDILLTHYSISILVLNKLTLMEEDPWGAE